MDDATRAPEGAAAQGSDAAYAPIADYALIGDCHACALVSRRGAIDWACLARFDAGSAFGRILDARRGGTFAVRPSEVVSVSRRYLPDTNVLETTFVTPTGRARLLDLFTMREGGSAAPHRQLLRVVEGLQGEVVLEVLIEPRFDYASLRPWIRREGRDLYSAVGGDDAFVLQAGCELTLDQPGAVLRGIATVRRGERCRFSLVSQRPEALKPVRLAPRELDRRLRETIAWWKRWVKRGHYGDTGHRDAVVRSALVLKLLTCAPTGAIIAAPTTSLPEAPGGPRNWDYRYCWIRDATLTMAALLEVGHPEVATGFKRFIERATAGHAEDLQIMYGAYGERRLVESELDLEGWRGSRPVRVGNAAALQKQLDVYGELLQAACLWHRVGGESRIDTDDEWRLLSSLVEAACTHWTEPDHGLWEVRGPPRHFVHSKVMCWVALQRGIELAEAEGQPCDVERWRRIRDEIRAAVEREGVDPERGCFVQSFGSKELDASLLLLPIVGFVPARDPRMLRTTQAIIQELTADGLVRRYRTEGVDDGLSGREGTFLMGSFWLVDVLAMQGELEEADRRFRVLLGVANDVGLLAEEYDPKSGELLGNFPQAFTHMALIEAAAQLGGAREAGHRAQPMADRPRPHARRSSRGGTRERRARTRRRRG